MQCAGFCRRRRPRPRPGPVAECVPGWHLTAVRSGRRRTVAGEAIVLAAQGSSGAAAATPRGQLTAPALPLLLPPAAARRGR
jgi:hypothetical protein